MSRIIEADFSPPSVETIKDMSRALIVDNNDDIAHSANPALNRASTSSTFETSDTIASPKRTEF
jgi:hypothetical protein